MYRVVREFKVGTRRYKVGQQVSAEEIPKNRLKALVELDYLEVETPTIPTTTEKLTEKTLKGRPRKKSTK